MQKEKRNKIISIVVNVIVSILVILAFAISINVIANTKKGYVPFFGKATVVVLSDSMNGDKPDSFKAGDAITIKILSEDEVQKLKVGDIITFYDMSISKELWVNERGAINSHRIVEVIYGTDADGNKTDFVSGFKTKGDHPDAEVDASVRNVTQVIGICEGHAGGFGSFLVWMQSKAGFFVCVILPVILIALYCVFLVVKSALTLKGNKNTVGEKERMRREVLREMGIDPDSEQGQAMIAAAEATEAPAEKTTGTAEAQPSDPTQPTRETVKEEAAPEAEATQPEQSKTNADAAETPTPAATAEKPAKRKGAGVRSAKTKGETAENKNGGSKPDQN